MKPELIYYGGHKLTEAPVFDAQNHILYFVAIRYNTIFALNVKTLEVNSFLTDGPVGGFVLYDDKMIEAEKRGIYSIDFKNGTKEKLHHIITYDKMRYNHIITDKKGRFLVDVIGDEDRCEGRGGLYSIDGQTSRCIISGTTVANGICLNSDQTKLYFTDTPAQKVWSYDYDLNTGNVSSCKEIIAYTGDGRPDGLCLDDKEYLYVTLWAGGKIDIINTNTNKKEEEILFPCKHVTAACIDGRDMYVTTAKCGAEDEVLYAGGIFKVKLN